MMRSHCANDPSSCDRDCEARIWGLPSYDVSVQLIPVQLIPVQLIPVLAQRSTCIGKGKERCDETGIATL